MGYWAYERVSTGGQDLVNQRVALERYAEAKGLTVTRFYGDVCGYPYTKRPEWDRMVRDLKRIHGRHRPEGLLVFRVDRLGRNQREASFFIERLEREGYKLISVHESSDTSTAIGRAMLEIILVLNQLEREQISEATKQRLEAARAAGKKIGRPRLSRHKRKRIEELGAQGYSPYEIIKETGYSPGTVYRYSKNGAATHSRTKS